eukprot:SAG11_NODE_18186_length_497_cov_2.399497_1_plen_88_part_00
MFSKQIPGIFGVFRRFRENHKGGPLVFCVVLGGVVQKDPIPLYLPKIWRLLTHDMQILWSSDHYSQGLHDRYSAAGVGGGWAIICFA